MVNFQESMDQQTERIDYIDKKVNHIDKKFNNIDKKFYDIGETLQERLGNVDEANEEMEGMIKENLENFQRIRGAIVILVEEQRIFAKSMEEFKESVLNLQAIEERKVQELKKRWELVNENRVEPDLNTGPSPGAVASAGAGAAPVSNTEQEASPNLTMTTPTPLNSQDDDQQTTMLLERESSAHIHPTPSFNPLPPTTVVPSSDLPPNNPLPHNPLPPADSSSVSPEHLSPIPNDPVVDRLSPESATGKGKRNQGKTPTVGDRRSPRIRANSRAPSPTNEGLLKQKRGTEEANGGDSKRRKVMPS